VLTLIYSLASTIPGLLLRLENFEDIPGDFQEF
jgi:hypothetical protein